MVEILIIIGTLMIGVLVGIEAQKRISVDYKKRWIEAKDLVKEISTSPLPNELMEKAGAIPKKALPTTYTLEIVYKSENGYPYAVFYAVKGKENHELGETYDYVGFPDLFRRDKEKYRKVVVEMNT